MKKRRLNLDFFAILHPLFLMMLGLIFYFAGLVSYFIHDIILNLVYYRIG